MAPVAQRAGITRRQTEGDWLQARARRSVISVFSRGRRFRGDAAVRCEAGDETGQESRSVARGTAPSLVAMKITICIQGRCNA